MKRHNALPNTSMHNDKLEIIADPRPAGRFSWLNRNVVGVTVTSFLGGAAHEMVTAVLAASATVGTLWTVASPAAAFGCAGVLMLVGNLLLAWNRRNAPKKRNADA